MKYPFFVLLLCSVHLGFSQATHSVLVAVNQPEQCIVLNTLGSAELNISVYPNPAGQNLVIVSERDIDQITIIDTTGRTVYTGQGIGKQFNLDVSRFNRGMYHFIIKNSTGVKRAKIILQ